MKFHTAALQFLIASEALRFGVRAQSVVADRTSDTNVADAGVSDVLLETPADSGGRFSVDGSSSKTGTTYHTVVDAGVSDVLLVTPVDSGGRFSGDESSSKTGTTYHTVADAGVSDVLLETPVDSGGRFSPSGIINHHAVVDAINDDDAISYFTSTDGGNVSAQRKLIKSSKKVKHSEALCSLSLFADSLFKYANQCFNDILVTISACDEKDDTCYISERLSSLPQEQEENQEEEQCFVGGSFPAKQNIRYNPSNGNCEFLYVDLVDDPCNLYIGDTGTGSLGLKARINVKNNPDVMFIQFTKDKGLTFYNAGDERVAKKLSPTHNVDRYLRQEGATKPVLSMMPRPFASRHRRMTDAECTFAIFDGGTVENLGLDLKCDPSQQRNLEFENWCEDNDCADPMWLDGCEGCMCFNYGNPTWCDGYRGDFYDTYFEEHGKNPWGDTNVKNRKCNPIFRPHRKVCSAQWQCGKWLYCEYGIADGGEKGLCYFCNDLFSTVNCDEL